MRTTRPPIRLFASLALVTACVTLGSSAEPPDVANPEAPAARPATPATEATTPQRVIIRVSRFREISGTIALEDDDVLVIRRKDGQLESFAMSRLLGVVRLVDPVPGQRGRVVLSNGESREGIIIEDSFERVVLEIEGVRAVFKRETVDHVRLEPSFEERYRNFKANLQPGMAQRHLDLCRWLVDKKAYALAADELALLVRRHELPEARTLMRVVDAQLVLLEERERREAMPREEPEPEVLIPLPDELLTNAEVNLIRVYEIDFRNPPKLHIPRAVVRTLLENYRARPEMPQTEAGRLGLYQADAADIVRLMFALRARDLYADIQVLSEPQALNVFRQRVHDGWLMNNCSTSRCHGGPSAGRFFLHRSNFKNARVRYTNLLILERLELDPAWPLLNYDSPRDSLLVQHALPREMAKRPHPDVPGWKPAFRRGNERVLRSTLQWLGGMMRPRVDYPIEYTPPSGDADGRASR